MKTVRVTVPATSANLGPGFDSLALALGMHNSIALSEAEVGLSFHITGEGADELPRDPSNMVVRAARSVFQAVGRAPSGLHVRIDSGVPLASGLGSSATAWLAGAVAANGLLGYPLSRKDLLKLVIDLEGHPDNVTAAFLGGLVISSYDGEELVYKTVSVQPMHVVVALPQVSYATGEARGALPEEVSLKDAAQNVGRTALVVQALAEGDYVLLGEAMRDRLHEPYRKKFVTGFEEVTNAARENGAAAVALSGAGPALVAFAESGHESIARAMMTAFEAATGSPARYWILSVDTQGIAISEMTTDDEHASISPSEDVPSQPRLIPREQTSSAPHASGEKASELASKATAPEPSRPLGLGEAAEMLRDRSGSDQRAEDEVSSGESKPESAQADDSNQSLRP